MAVKGELFMWAVYDHPRDFPESFVARRFRLDQPLDGPEDVIKAATLDEIRAQMRQRRLTRVERSVMDDPVILETWL